MQAKEVREILVQEIMSSQPRTGNPDMTVKEAAALMLREGVGSLVILEDGEPVGILTERDLLYKVIALGRTSRVRVDKVMSSPVITVSPDSNVSVAAKRMSDLHLRRLPVVEDGKLIGMLTEKDILKISPSLIELTREWSKIGQGLATRPNGRGFVAGYCESCDSYSIDLRLENGALLCADCREE
jgi:CBS domain-containing protein